MGTGGSVQYPMGVKRVSAPAAPTHSRHYSGAPPPNPRSSNAGEAGWVGAGGVGGLTVGGSEIGLNGLVLKRRTG
ncbi:hypothetical protein GCM10010306_093690 [Streptomyces umbrinus]|nr:hypothetical protein GCM10010306_093690 [Streptomyces umbrinus]